MPYSLICSQSSLLESRDYFDNLRDLHLILEISRQLLPAVLLHNALNFLGLISCAQPNTYDVSIYGVNSFIGAYYLCALRYFLCFFVCVFVCLLS